MDNKDKKTCSACGQSFSSDSELENHRRTAHPQGGGSEKQPTSGQPRDTGKDREEVA